MAYVYLIDLHRLIDQSLAEAAQLVDNTTNNAGEIRYHQGRIQASLGARESSRCLHRTEARVLGEKALRLRPG